MNVKYEILFTSTITFIHSVSKGQVQQSLTQLWNNIENNAQYTCTGPMKEKVPNLSSHPKGLHMQVLI